MFQPLQNIPIYYQAFSSTTVTPPKDPHHQRPQEEAQNRGGGDGAIHFASRIMGDEIMDCIMDMVGGLLWIIIHHYFTMGDKSGL